MHPLIRRQRHRTQLNHIDRLKQGGLLLRRWLRADLREVQVLPRLLHIAGHKPVSGNNLVERQKLRLIRVDVIAEEVTVKPPPWWNRSLPTHRCDILTRYQ